MNLYKQVQTALLCLSIRLMKPLFIYILLLIFYKFLSLLNLNFMLNYVMNKDETKSFYKQRRLPLVNERGKNYEKKVTGSFTNFISYLHNCYNSPHLCWRNNRINSNKTSFKYFSYYYCFMYVHLIMYCIHFICYLLLHCAERI